MFSVLVFINCNGFTDKEVLFTPDIAACGKANLETHYVCVYPYGCTVGGGGVCVLVCHKAASFSLG